MARLFLIGNGYDIKRRKDTSYYCFKEWLKKEYLDKYYKDLFKDNDINYHLFFEKTYAPACLLKNLKAKNKKKQKERDDLINASERHDILKSLAILFKSMEYLNDTNWSKFEDNLSSLPLDRFIEEYRKYNQEHNIALESSLGSTVDREIDEICFNNKIPFLFAEWISNLKEICIEKNGFEKQMINSIQDDDTFIIFNYTDTIEKIFNSDNKSIFYHIHGIKNEKDTIVVGHNCKEKSHSTNLDNEEQYINDIYSRLYKNPEIVIKKNQQLWNRISQFKELDIYEFGWSCSNADSDYIKKIISIIDENNIKIRMHFNNFNNEGKDKIKIWKSCGLNNNCSYFLYEEKDYIYEIEYKEKA